MSSSFALLHVYTILSFPIPSYPLPFLYIYHSISFHAATLHLFITLYHHSAIILLLFFLWNIHILYSYNIFSISLYSKHATIKHICNPSSIPLPLLSTTTYSRQRDVLPCRDIFLLYTWLYICVQIVDPAAAAAVHWSELIRSKRRKRKEMNENNLSFLLFSLFLLLFLSFLCSDDNICHLHVYVCE